MSSTVNAQNNSAPPAPAPLEVRSLVAPMPGIISFCGTNTHLFFGTVKGCLCYSALTLAPAPANKPYFSATATTVPLPSALGISSNDPIDVLLVNEDYSLLALLTKAKEVIVLSVDSCLALNVISTTKKNYEAQLRYQVFHLDNVVNPSVVAMDEEEQKTKSSTCCNLTYTPHQAAHQWISNETLLIGTTNGAVVKVSLDVRHREGKQSSSSSLEVIPEAQEESPIVQLCHCCTNKNNHLLAVSSIARNTLVKLKSRSTEKGEEEDNMEGNANTEGVPLQQQVVQIGKKSRQCGEFGACFNSTGTRVFASRPAKRVYEAGISDADMGKVYKTFIVLPDIEPELSLLERVTLRANGGAGEKDMLEASQNSNCLTSSINSNSNNGGGKVDDEILVTFSAKFIGVLNITNAVWVGTHEVVPSSNVTGFTPPRILGWTYFRNYLLVLSSNGSILTIPIGPTIPAVPTASLSPSSANPVEKASPRGTDGAASLFQQPSVTSSSSSPNGKQPQATSEDGNVNSASVTKSNSSATSTPLYQQQRSLSSQLSQVGTEDTRSNGSWAPNNNNLLLPVEEREGFLGPNGEVLIEKKSCRERKEKHSHKSSGGRHRHHHRNSPDPNSPTASSRSERKLSSLNIGNSSGGGTNNIDFTQLLKDDKKKNKAGEENVANSNPTESLYQMAPPESLVQLPDHLFSLGNPSEGKKQKAENDNIKTSAEGKGREKDPAVDESETTNGGDNDSNMPPLEMSDGIAEPQESNHNSGDNTKKKQPEFSTTTLSPSRPVGQKANSPHDDDATDDPFPAQISSSGIQFDAVKVRQSVQLNDGCSIVFPSETDNGSSGDAHFDSTTIGMLVKDGKRGEEQILVHGKMKSPEESEKNSLLSSEKIDEQPRQEGLPYSDLVLRFDEQTCRLCSTYRVCSLDRRAHPALFAETISWVPELEKVINEDDQLRLVEGEKMVRFLYLSGEDVLRKIVMLLSCVIEWLSYIPVPVGVDATAFGFQCFRLLNRLKLQEDERAELCEKCVTALASREEFQMPVRECAAFCAALICGLEIAGRSGGSGSGNSHARTNNNNIAQTTGAYSSSASSCCAAVVTQGKCFPLLRSHDERKKIAEEEGENETQQLPGQKNNNYFMMTTTTKSFSLHSASQIAAALSPETWYPTSTLMASGGISFGGIEQLIVKNSSTLVETVQLGQHASSLTLHYFPFVFAVQPYKAVHLAISAFPTLSTFHLEWSLSEEIYSQVVKTLQKAHAAYIEPLTAQDLQDFLCDFMMQLIQQHKEDLAFQHPKMFSHVVKALLSHRYYLKNNNNHGTVASSGKKSTTSSTNGGAPTLVTRRKIQQITHAVLDLLKCTIASTHANSSPPSSTNSPLKKLTTERDSYGYPTKSTSSSSGGTSILIICPELRNMFKMYDFPEGVVELKYTESYIQEHIKNGNIGGLLSLFQLPQDDVITESHWINLFICSHAVELLEQAVYLCLSVVGTPKAVRYLLRRAFPFVDSEEIEDAQLRLVIRKLSPIFEDVNSEPPSTQSFS